MTPEQQRELLHKIGEYQHLPREFRDFHAQKDLFKSFYEWFRPRVEKLKKRHSGGDITLSEFDSMTWMGAHVFTIDHLLYWLALHGYRLQRWNPQCETYDVQEVIAARREQELDDLAVLFASRKKEKEEEATSSEDHG